MRKRRLFNTNDSSSNLSLIVPENMSPNRGGIHPALINTVSSASVLGKRKRNKCISDVHPKEAAKKPKPDFRADAQDSDTDSLEDPVFFSASVQKLPYTKEEDEIILKYVLKGQNIFRVSSVLLWKHLESKKENPRRTHHSLKNRFLRNIKPFLFTTFAHLTKDKTITERILCKFPELKQSLGRREILTNIKLPERKPLPKPAEEDGVSSTSTDDYRGNEDRISSFRLPEPDDVSISAIHSHKTPPERNEVKAVNSDCFKFIVHKRIIKARGNDITVSVDFKSKKYVKTPSLGIYEMFEKLKRKNRFGFCPTCGRYSTPKRSSVFKYNKETSIIPNSVDTPETSSKCPKKRIWVSKLKNNTKPEQRKISSEPQGRSPCSPSLLSDIGEAREVDKPSSESPKENSKASTRSLKRDASANGNKSSQVSSSLTPAEKPESNESRNEILRLATANSKSAEEGNSRTANPRRDSDEDIESICEDAVTNFRKLIDYEEEQQLVRKCLNRNYRIIGLEEVSQANWDSYFLESSPDLDTPPLTIDFETDSQNNENTEQNTSTSNSSLSKNRKKGGGKKKKS